MGKSLGRRECPTPSMHPPLPWLRRARHLSAPNPPVTVPVGGDANKKRVLSGSIAPPPSTDTPMIIIIIDHLRMQPEGYGAAIYIF